MTLTIRVSAKEAEAIKAGVAPKSLADKVDRAELRASAKGSSIPVQAAIEAFREVLGTRLVLPLAAQYGQIGVLLRNTGLTRSQCTSIAKTAAAEWRSGPIRAISLVRQADVLLAGAQQNIPGTAGAPLGLEDE